MTTLARSSGTPLAAHAVCAAAGARDGLRAAQFYIRDLSNADHAAKGEQRRAPLLSRAVAQGARLADRLMNRGANLDRTVSYVEAELLLLNITRARHHRPVHFDRTTFA